MVSIRKMLKYLEILRLSIHTHGYNNDMLLFYQFKHKHTLYGDLTRKLSSYIVFSWISTFNFTMKHHAAVISLAISLLAHVFFSPDYMLVDRKN